MNKVTTHNEVRRSPQEEHFRGHMQVNKTMSQDYSNSFLRPIEKKILENKHSFVAPSRTPPKMFFDKHNEESKNGHKLFKTPVP